MALCLSPTVSAEVDITLQQARQLIRMRPDGLTPALPDEAAVRDSLQRISDHLPSLEDEEIRNYLHQLGVEAEEGQGRRTADQISHENLQRELRGSSLQADTFIAKAVHRYLSLYRHNTVVMFHVKDQPLWVSSSQLKKMGLNGGLQQANEFNRDFLTTSNWIFFFVGYDNEKQYGENSIAVSADYARGHGLLFPFVMRVRELLEVGEVTTPDTVKEINEEMRKRDPKGTMSEERFVEIYRDRLKVIRRSLGRYLFTTEDYEILVRTKVSEYLNRLSLLERFKWRAQLATPGLRHSALTALVAKAFADFQLPKRFEMRIPVAIPGRSLLTSCEQALIP